MAILRKIKERLKNIIQKNKESIKYRKIPSVLEDTPKSKKKEEAIGHEEMLVEKAKFSTPDIPKPAPKFLQELPYGYGEDKIVLQTRDPWWIHAYWEVTPQTFNHLTEKLGEAFFSAKLILRVYDVSFIIFDGTNAHRFFDIEINPQTNNWYIDTAGPGRSWCIDMGLRMSNGKFIKITRSNIVYTPLDGPSGITDEEWMIPEDMFARLYGMGFGLGRSSPVGKAWQERLKKALFSGILASPGITSVSSPVKVPGERKFWLVVNTELIVYGATEPDAKVSVQGKEIKLRPDGTFTLRFALPDGKQFIPVKAVSGDNLEERTITPIVAKETK